MLLKFAESKDLFFSERVKNVLRIPLGIAIFRNEEESIKKLKILLEDFTPKLLITVGDVVSTNVINYGLSPDLSIIDYKTKRLERKTPIEDFFDKIYSVKNKPSTISVMAWKIIQKAFKDLSKEKKVLIIVDGEEDLLAIPSVLSSPENSFILYGQPNDALVVIVSSMYVKIALEKYILEEVIQV